MLKISRGSVSVGVALCTILFVQIRGCTITCKVGLSLSHTANSNTSPMGICIVSSQDFILAACVHSWIVVLSAHRAFVCHEITLITISINTSLWLAL